MSRPRVDKGPCRRSPSRRPMTSSKSTIERLCCGPSNSTMARASWSWADWISRWVASGAGAGAPVWASPGRLRARRASTTAPGCPCPLPRLMLSPRMPPPLAVAQHLLRPLVPHEDGARGVEGQRSRFFQLRAREAGQALAGGGKDLDRPFLVRHVGDAERIHGRVHRPAQARGAHRSQEPAGLVEDADRPLLAVEKDDAPLPVHEHPRDDALVRVLLREEALVFGP